MDLSAFNPAAANSAAKRDAQLALTAAGFYKGRIDAQWGPLSQSALQRWEARAQVGRNGYVLPGDRSRYNVVAYIDGADIRMDSVVATWFGGPDDPDDNGETASGYSTLRNPLEDYCSLPMPIRNLCAGTPLPVLPWGTSVAVERCGGGGSAVALLRDVGPSPEGLAIGIIDLSPGIFRKFGSALKGAHGCKPSTGSYLVNVRIIGGAAHVKPAQA